MPTTATVASPTVVGPEWTTASGRWDRNAVSAAVGSGAVDAGAEVDSVGGVVEGAGVVVRVGVVVTGDDCVDDEREGELLQPATRSANAAGIATVSSR